MSDPAPESASKPVFARCPRCDYSLRGLPANHACPECGLRFDERCEVYRTTNPMAAFFILLCMSGGTVGMIRGASYLDDLGTATWTQKLWAISAVVWFVGVAVLVWKLTKVYRRGQYVAVTTDGLIVRMVGFKEDLMPWADIRTASVKDAPEGKPQVALLRLRQGAKVIPIGGVYNVFPTRAHVERFIAHVNQRVED